MHRLLLHRPDLLRDKISRGYESRPRYPKKLKLQNPRQRNRQREFGESRHNAKGNNGQNLKVK